MRNVHLLNGVSIGGVVGILQGFQAKGTKESKLKVKALRKGKVEN